MAKQNDNQILLYETKGGETRVEVLYEGETVWLTQAQMAELFQTTKQNISLHINNIFDEGELDRNRTVKKYLTVQSEGNRSVKRKVDHYNLDMIISVGYRVNSRRGTHFRIWATKTLRDYIVKGFAVDEDRLAHGDSNYFKELEETVRRIRASEYNFYKKVRDIFATSMDYDSKSPEAKQFFATVQNKFHYAIHGQTAAELVLSRVGADKLNMGLTNWRGDTMTLEDAFIAKNYLEAAELQRLELLVESFLSFALFQIADQRPMYMTTWVRKLDQFIGELNEKPVLQNAGTVSKAQKEAKVKVMFEAYRERYMVEEALKEDEFNRMLEDAAKHYLPPPEDDVDDDGFSREEYMDYLSRVSRPVDEDD